MCCERCGDDMTDSHDTTTADRRPVLCEVRDRVAIVSLNRPHRSNAWNGAMHAALIATMSELETRNDVRAVVITGMGRAFSVGGDAAALSDHADRGSYDPGIPDDIVRPGSRDAAWDEDLSWLLGYRWPVIAAVNGACAGVALALVAFCDLRFVAAGAKMTTAAPRLGLPAEYGLSWTLPRLIGTTRAAELLLSGRVFTGAETAEWGLWNGVCEDGPATVDAAMAWAHNLVTTTGPAAVTTAKRQLHTDWLATTPAESVAESKRGLNTAMGTSEYREGIAAFTEGRPPQF